VQNAINDKEAHQDIIDAWNFVDDASNAYPPTAEGMMALKAAGKGIKYLWNLGKKIFTAGAKDFKYSATVVNKGESVFTKILSGVKDPNTVSELNKLALKALEKPNSTYITGIIRSDGTIEAHLNVMGSTSHNALGLTKNDVGFNMSFYDGNWVVSGSGLAGPPNNWAKPSPAQIDFLKTVFGVK
jgi:hypothetical protein